MLNGGLNPLSIFVRAGPNVHK